jgi:arylsulfatase A-like enzyme
MGFLHKSNEDDNEVEQPLDFTKLAKKYDAFATNFIRKHRDQPFFLDVPFSHVHVTSSTQSESQYVGCQWKNFATRGAFGDALAESDWMVGNVVSTLKAMEIEESTRIIFASDNGPWLEFRRERRSPAFAYWNGKIEPFSRSSSMDVFPTLSALADVPLLQRSRYRWS